MEYTVKGLGKLAGVSARTLRYYDQIGLLKPRRISSSGYRIYGESSVDTLQQILFYRELGFGLSEIKKILLSPSFDRMEALKGHLGALKERREQLDRLIETVNKTILTEEGKTAMTDREKFEGFKSRAIEENEKKYGAEIREKYGDKTVDAGNEKFGNLTPEQYRRMQELEARLLSGLEQAVRNGSDPAGETGKKLAEMHREWLTFVWPEYTEQAHAGLVRMYVEDERFRKHYDGGVKGCAAFLRDAVLAHTGGKE